MDWYNKFNIPYMQLDKKREEIQKLAFDCWLQQGKVGTCAIITGLGKTFISFWAMLSMPKGSNCLFLAETTVNLAA